MRYFIHIFSSRDYWSTALVLHVLWGLYTCCAINPLTDYVLDWYVKTLIKATWIDLLGETDLFIKLGVSSLDICQSEFVCKVNTAQQLDAEWRGDVCHSAACQINISVIDLRVSVCMCVPQWGKWNTILKYSDILLHLNRVNDYLLWHI